MLSQVHLTSQALNDIKVVIEVVLVVLNWQVSCINRSLLQLLVVVLL